MLGCDATFEHSRQQCSILRAGRVTEHVNHRPFRPDLQGFRSTAPHVRSSSREGKVTEKITATDAVLLRQSLIDVKLYWSLQIPSHYALAALVK